jgi:hypothetical protein
VISTHSISISSFFDRPPLYAVGARLVFWRFHRPALLTVQRFFLFDDFGRDDRAASASLRVGVGRPLPPPEDDG